MAEQKIELRRVRDFGENLSDTFGFIREQAGPLLKSFLAITAIFIVAQGIFNSTLESHLNAMVRGTLMGANPNNIRSILWGIIRAFGFNILMVIIINFLTVVSMQVTVSAYLKYYIETGTKPGIQEVWALFKQYFFKVLLFKFIADLAFIIAFVFCFIPGIYLGIVLAPLSLIAVIEDKSLGEAFERCFNLIRENFWSSLGLYIVAYIMYMIATGVIGASLSVISTLAGLLTTSDLSSYVVAVTAFFKSFALFFYIIIFICIALNYFSLVERRDGTGMLSRINNMGNNFTGPKSTEDQF